MLQYVPSTAPLPLDSTRPITHDSPCNDILRLGDLHRSTSSGRGDSLVPPTSILHSLHHTVLPCMLTVALNSCTIYVDLPADDVQ